jgi:16S rRNA (uracil1498-N3)-methyltransferase
VLRKRTGEQVALTDGQGYHYGVDVCDARRGKTTAKIVHKKLMPRKCSLEITVGFVPVKGLRNDLMIEKGTELGVTGFVVFHSEHAVVKNIGAQKIDRWKKIAASAMTQSQQYYLPEVQFAPSIEELSQAALRYDRIFVADPSGKTDIPAGAQRILLLVGPEGGFTESEKDFLVKQGALLLSLGPTRLRSETAVIVGVSKILTAYGADLTVTEYRG